MRGLFKKTNRNLIEQVGKTRDGQYPIAAILSCIDSRVPIELVFDQGIGDVFSVRVAGNITALLSKIKPAKNIVAVTASMGGWMILYLKKWLFKMLIPQYLY